MSISSVSWPERLLFVSLCGATAGAPLAGYLLIRALPGAPEGRWFDTGVYLSWAFLIYFSWACLPDLDLPAKKRAVAWVSFGLLEFGYPVASWLFEGGTRAHLFADLASCFSTSLALAAGGFLLWRSAGGLRRGDWGLLLPLAFVGFFIGWPGLAVEWDWWTTVELPSGDVLSQVLRALGVITGTTGVLRNMLASELLR